MTRFQRACKALALFSATILISGYILYRVVFEQAFMPSSKSTFIFVGGSVKPEPPAPPTDSATQHEAATQPNPSR
jgi:hypothetical protein